MIIKSLFFERLYGYEQGCKGNKPMLVRFCTAQVYLGSMCCTAVLIGTGPASPPALGLIYSGAVGQPRKTTSLCDPLIEPNKSKCLFLYCYLTRYSCSCIYHRGSKLYKILWRTASLRSAPQATHIKTSLCCCRYSYSVNLICIHNCVQKYTSVYLLLSTYLFAFMFRVLPYWRPEWQTRSPNSPTVAAACNHQAAATTANNSDRV